MQTMVTIWIHLQTPNLSLGLTEAQTCRTESVHCFLHANVGTLSPVKLPQAAVVDDVLQASFQRFFQTFILAKTMLNKMLITAEYFYII